MFYPAQEHLPHGCRRNILSQNAFFAPFVENFNQDLAVSFDLGVTLAFKITQVIIQVAPRAPGGAGRACPRNIYRSEPH